MAELLNLGGLETLLDLTYALLPVLALSVVDVLWAWLLLSQLVVVLSVVVFCLGFLVMVVMVGLLAAFLALYCKLPAFVPIWPILSPPVLVSRIRCFLALLPIVFLFSVAFAVVPFVLDLMAVVPFVLDLMTLVLLALAASSFVAFVLEFEALGQKGAVRKLVQALAQKRALLCRCAETFLALNCGLKLVVPKRLRDAPLFGLEVGCYIQMMLIHTWAVPLVLLQIFSFFLP